MDADFSHDPADLARLLDAVRGGADARARLALRRGRRRSPTGGACAASISRGGSWYARRVLGVGVRDLTGGFKCFRARCSRRSTSPTVRSHGYAFQVELTYRALLRRRSRRRGADRLPRPPARRVEDVVADRGRGGLARPRAPPERARRDAPGRRIGSSSARRAPMRCLMRRSAISCSSRACAARGATLRRWNGARRRVRGSGARSRSSVAAALRRRRGRSSRPRRRRRRLLLPGLMRADGLAADVAVASSRNSLVLACTPSRASRGSSPAARCRRGRALLRLWRASTRPARWRSRSSTARRVLARHAGLVLGAHARRRQLHVARRCCRSASLPHAFPAERPSCAAADVGARQRRGDCVGCSARPNRRRKAGSEPPRGSVRGTTRSTLCPASGLTVERPAAGSACGRPV